MEHRKLCPRADPLIGDHRLQQQGLVGQAGKELRQGLIGLLHPVQVQPVPLQPDAVQAAPGPVLIGQHPAAALLPQKRGPVPGGHIRHSLRQGHDAPAACSDGQAVQVGEVLPSQDTGRGKQV